MAAMYNQSPVYFETKNKVEAWDQLTYLTTMGSKHYSTLAAYREDHKTWVSQKDVNFRQGYWASMVDGATYAKEQALAVQYNLLFNKNIQANETVRNELMYYVQNGLVAPSYITEGLIKEYRKRTPGRADVDEAICQEEYDREVDKGKRLFSLALDLTPVVGQVKALGEIATGKNLVTGDKLNGWDYAFSVVGLVFSASKVGSAGGKAVNVASDFAKVTGNTFDTLKTEGSYFKTFKNTYNEVKPLLASQRGAITIPGKAGAGEVKAEVVTKPKPYTNSRPNYGKGQVEQVWENAKDPVTGKVYDPTGVEINWSTTKPRNGQWDMGHIPGEKYSEMHKLYMDGVISKEGAEEFLQWYRNPNNYRPELPGTNRGHQYE